MVTPSHMFPVIDEFNKQDLHPAASSLQIGISGPTHLGGPLLPRGDRPDHRRGADRGRAGEPVFTSLTNEAMPVMPSALPSGQP